MLCVFAQISCLLYRPKIRASLGTYQKQVFSYLQDQVKEITSTPFDVSTACGMPLSLVSLNISGRIKLIKEKNTKLEAIKARLAEVLGPQWSQMSEAQTFNFQIEQAIKQFDAEKV